MGFAHLSVRNCSSIFCTDINTIYMEFVACFSPPSPWSRKCIESTQLSLLCSRKMHMFLLKKQNYNSIMNKNLSFYLMTHYGQKKRGKKAQNEGKEVCREEEWEKRAVFIMSIKFLTQCDSPALIHMWIPWRSCWTMDSGSAGPGRDWDSLFLTSSQMRLMAHGPRLEELQFMTSWKYQRSQRTVLTPPELSFVLKILSLSKQGKP